MNDLWILVVFVYFSGTNQIFFKRPNILFHFPDKDDIPVVDIVKRRKLSLRVSTRQEFRLPHIESVLTFWNYLVLWRSRSYWHVPPNIPETKDWKHEETKVNQERMNEDEIMEMRNIRRIIEDEHEEELNCHEKHDDDVEDKCLEESEDISLISTEYYWRSLTSLTLWQSKLLGGVIQQSSGDGHGHWETQENRGWLDQFDLILLTFADLDEESVLVWEVVVEEGSGEEEGEGSSESHVELIK